MKMFAQHWRAIDCKKNPQFKKDLPIAARSGLTALAGWRALNLSASADALLAPATAVAGVVVVPLCWCFGCLLEVFFDLLQEAK